MIITPGQTDPVDPQLQQKFAAAIHMAKSIWELCNDPDIRAYSAESLVNTTDVTDPIRMGAEYRAMDDAAQAFMACREELAQGGYQFLTIEDKMTSATNHLLNLPVEDMLQLVEHVAAAMPEYAGYIPYMQSLVSLKGRLKIIMAPFLVPVSNSGN